MVAEGMLYETGIVTMSGNARIEGNFSSRNGGGLNLFEQFSSLTMNDDAAIRGNTAVDGGGVYVAHYDSEGLGLIMNDRAVIENNISVASDWPGDWDGGGGAYVDNGGSARLNDSSAIRNNTTVGNGGGIFAWGDVTLRGTSSIEGNHADGTGGGIFLFSYSGKATVGANATLANNTPTDCDGDGTC